MVFQVFFSRFSLGFSVIFRALHGSPVFCGVSLRFFSMVFICFLQVSNNTIGVSVALCFYCLLVLLDLLK